MLSADPLNGLAHHCRCAEIDETIAQFADGGIRGKPRGCVRAAALDAEQELRDVAAFLLLHSCRRRHLARRTDGLFDGLERTAFLLYAEGDDGL